ncbi:MAG: hypothetical protein OXB84_02665 [Halobacteriovoraceae bacterium]|nr:hypothetical protein [Halobacteriovoraceae bacterium]
MKIISMILIFLIYPCWGKDSDKEKWLKSEDFTKAVEDEVQKKFNKLRGINNVDFSWELLKREKEIKIGELELKKQREQLVLDQQELQKKLSTFLKSQKNFISCIEEKGKEKSKRIGHMVDVISKMNSKAAAKMLGTQDPSVSVKILERLKAEKISKIFNYMDKEISTRLQKQYMTMKK